MTAVQVIETQLRVTSVRSRGVFGGVIFAGKSEAGELYVVKADFLVMPDSSLVEVAQVWRVVGTPTVVGYTHAGIEKTEVQIVPMQLELQRPSGNNLVAWIAQSPDCKGIGDVRARRLYERFGLDLVAHIEAGDVDRLAEVVDIESAESLIAAFAKHGIAQTLVWLEQMGLPREIAASVSRYWGKNGRSKVEANPYVLVSFCASWKTVDELARSRFGVQQNDSRRLIAAAEDALYRGMTNGDTALSRVEALDRLRGHVGGAALAREALDAAVADGKVIEDGDLLQAAGLAYIESFVADSLAAMQAGKSQDQDDLFVVEVPDKVTVEHKLALYESMQHIELTPEQRAAVVTSASSRVSLILGGAGTGKTTVLKALCHVLERVDPGVEIHQFALAGRAAQRMHQSTGRPAATIAAFLNGQKVAPGSTVLIDEMSMVDVILMYRVLKQLPSSVRLVMIGDPSQLPPIGPGLVLHALDGLASMPQTTLKTVKRQSSASGIPQVAAAVREHRQPTWAAYDGLGHGVSAIPCSDADLDAVVAKVYEELEGKGSDSSVQILGTTKSGHGGVKSLNARLHARFTACAEPVKVQNPEFGYINHSTDDGLTLHVGDLVIFGANDYSLGLRNGSLGKILPPVNLPVTSLNSSSGTSLGAASSVCRAEFEGVVYELSASNLQHVNHAYCITVHKSQGSQFERVIIPIRKSKLLDNAMLYTAITRGVNQVILVGDVAAAEDAIHAASKASRRTTRLGKRLAAGGQHTNALGAELSTAAVGACDVSAAAVGNSGRTSAASLPPARRLATEQHAA